VLFISGYAEKAVLGHGALAPGMEVMTKPFPIGALASRINDLIAVPAEALSREADLISPSRPSLLNSAPSEGSDHDG
jgi:hypothetical protein